MIEKPVPRFADWHHKACRVMTNGDRKGRIILSHPHTKTVDYLSCSPLKTTFYVKKNTWKLLPENPEFPAMRHGDIILT